MDNLQKKVDIAKSIASTTENPDAFLRCLELLGESSTSMQIRPYNTITPPSINDSSASNESDDEEEDT